MKASNNETVADILRAMSKMETVFHHLYWCEYADRINVAHKREIEAKDAEIERHDQHYRRKVYRLIQALTKCHRRIKWLEQSVEKANEIATERKYRCLLNAEVLEAAFALGDVAYHVGVNRNGVYDPNETADGVRKMAGELRTTKALVERLQGEIERMKEDEK